MRAATLGLFALVIAGTLAPSLTRAQSPEICAPVEQLDKYRYLRQLTLDLYGRIPTVEEYERLHTLEDVSEEIIDEIMGEFMSWLDTLRFVPTIQAIKHKLNDLKNSELTNQRKKNPNFNEDQAELVTSNIIQKITNQFAHHLKEDSSTVDESLELIKKIFQLEETT